MVKSAYERALEKLEAEGIERPQENALSAEVKEQVAEARRKAKARLAELEIMHAKALAKLADRAARAKEQQNYQAERRRIESARDEKIERLRKGSDNG